VNAFVTSTVKCVRLEREYTKVFTKVAEVRAA
jgi:hypothetical protein